MTYPPVKINGTAATLFWVFDSSNAAVTGLADGDFTKKLTKNTAHDTTAVTVAEVSAANQPGLYKATWAVGASAATLPGFELRVTHATHNPLGWMAIVPVVERLHDDLAFPNVTGRGMNVAALGYVDADLQKWRGLVPANLGGAGASVVADLSHWLAVAPNALNSGKVRTHVDTIEPGGIDNTSFNSGAITEDALNSSAVVEIADGVRSNLAVELARVDVAVSSRLATSGYTVPPSAAAIVAATLAGVVDGTVSLKVALARILAATANKVTGEPANPVDFYNPAGDAVRLRSTIDENGNRTVAYPSDPA